MRHLQAENAYAQCILKASEAFQRELFDEMLSRLPLEQVSEPERVDGYEYFVRMEEGSNLGVYCRRTVDAAGVVGDDEVVLDLNRLPFRWVHVSVCKPNEDHSLLAYVQQAHPRRWQRALRMAVARIGCSVHVSPTGTGGNQH